MPGTNQTSRQKKRPRVFFRNKKARFLTTSGKPDRS